MEKSEPDPNEKKNSLLRVFLSGYTPSPIPEATFSKAVIKKYPKIKSVNYPNKKEKWTGFAFADFDLREEFLEFVKLGKIVLEELDMVLIVKPHKTGKALKRYLKDVKKRKIEVINIPDNWNSENLENFFSEFGEIENCYIEKNDRNLPNKAVVSFMLKEIAKNCKIIGKFDIGNGIFLEIFDKTKKNLQHKETQKQYKNKKGNFNNAKNQISKRFRNPKKLLRFHREEPTSEAYFISRKEFFQKREMKESDNFRLNKKTKEIIRSAFFEF